MEKKRKGAKTNILSHTKAKLELYKKYLVKYLSILGVTKSINKINIYDIFCGTGIYEDGNKGSPIIAYHCIKQNRDFFKQKKWELKPISLIVNDGNSQSVQKVKEHLLKFNQEEQICDLDFNELDSEEMFQKTIQDIQNQSYYERNLIFIDPYGYKEIHKKELSDLLETNKTEIILFLPIQFMYRFKDIVQKDFDNNSYKKLRNFIYDFFEDEHPIRKGDDINIFTFINYLKTAFSFSGKFYSASHYIQRDKSNFYALFFITPNILGFERILGTKWELDKGEGRGFEKPETRQLTLFGKDILNTKKINRMKELRELLINYLSVTFRNNIKLYEYVLKNEFLPKHANEVLKQLQEEDKIIVWDVEKNKLARKSSFYLNYENFIKKNIKVKINLK